MKKRRPVTKSRKRRKRASRASELSTWQRRVLDIVKDSSIPEIAKFGGGAALSAVFLHHRRTADLDFFLDRPLQPADLRGIARAIARDGTRIDEQVVGSLTSLVLLDSGRPYGKIDFSFYPANEVEAATVWNGLRVESLRDMTVNKVGAFLNRNQARDYVDLYFLLQEGPERDLVRLLDLLRAKLDLSADPLTMASRLLGARAIVDLPDMIRPLELSDLRAFCFEKARELVRKG